MAHQASKGDSGSDFPGLSEVPATTLPTYVQLQGPADPHAAMLILQQQTCVMT